MLDWASSRWSVLVNCILPTPATGKFVTIRAQATQLSSHDTSPSAPCPFLGNIQQRELISRKFKHMACRFVHRILSQPQILPELNTGCTASFGFYHGCRGLCFSFWFGFQLTKLLLRQVSGENGPLLWSRLPLEESCSIGICLGWIRFRNVLIESRLVTVCSKRWGKLFDRRIGKAEFKFSIGADFLNRDIMRCDWGLP